MLADNKLSGGFEALAEADLQNLVRLDLSGNFITNLDVLRPLVRMKQQDLLGATMLCSKYPDD